LVAFALVVGLADGVGARWGEGGGELWRAWVSCCRRGRHARPWWRSPIFWSLVPGRC